MSSITHGTESGYSYHKCRCDACRGGRAARVRERAARRGAGVPAPARVPAPIPHGTNAGYGRGCRCEACGAARREYRTDWRLRTGRTTPAPPSKPVPAPAAPKLSSLLEARDRSLSLLIASNPRSVAATEARLRRAEIRKIRALIDGATA